MISHRLKLVEPQPDAEQELRAALRTRIQERDSAQQRHDKAAERVERASQFVKSLEANLATFASVDQRIASARGESFKRSICEGAAAPMLSLSPELAKAAGQKLDAENQLAGARQAQAELSNELAETQATLACMEAEVVGAARAVIGHRVEIMAHELQTAEQHAAALRKRLLAAGAHRPGGPLCPLSPGVVGMLRDVPLNSIDTRHSADDVAAWSHWLTRLAHDAEAQFDEG